MPSSSGAAAGLLNLLRDLGVVRPEPKEQEELQTVDILVPDLSEDAHRVEFVADAPKYQTREAENIHRIEINRMRQGMNRGRLMPCRLDVNLVIFRNRD